MNRRTFGLLASVLPRSTLGRTLGVAVLFLVTIFIGAPRSVSAEVVWQSAPSHTDELQVYTPELSHPWFGTEDHQILYLGTWNGPDFTTDASTTVHLWARWNGNTGGYYDGNILDVGLESSSGGFPYDYIEPMPIIQIILNGYPYSMFTYQTVSSTTTLEEISIPVHPGVTIHHGEELWTTLVQHIYYANFWVGATGHTPQFQICEGACASPPITLTPVIIVPGILGSAQHNGEWLIDPITHAYDNLIDTLAANGYEKEKTLFTFPYDWHVSNVTTATLLKNKIDEIKTICNCDKVDLVAHSMGGLVARQYIQSADYQHDVRKLIFLGTPQLGAPSAYLMWEGGETDTNFDGQKLKYFLLTEAIKHGYTNLFDYIRQTSISSVRELLPVYGYIKHTGSPEVPAYPNTSQYPSNPFLENLDNSVSNLYNSGVSITNFVGELAGSSTIATIRVVSPSTISSNILWRYGYPEGFTNSNGDNGLERGAGDGTVPISSANFIIQNLRPVNSKHGNLPTDTEGQIFKTLTNRDAISLITGEDTTDFKMLILQILSPADIAVIAPDGKRVGKDFGSGQELNEIPNAFYTGYQGDQEYVTIPNPLNGQYKIITQGTGSGGEYTLAIGIITDATSTETFFSGQTVPNLITEHDVDVDTVNPDETKIVPADQLPPTISIVQPATTTYTHADLMPIDVAFADDTIATSSVVFDATPIPASSIVDLFFQSLGAHTLTASATDLVNNATTSKTIIQVIATYSSTASDINRAFGLGWILKKDVKDDLLNKLGKVVKIEKKIDTIVVSTKPKVEKKVERLEQKIDAVLLRALIRDVQQAYKNEKINDRAYRLLADDLNWPINH